MIPVVAFHKSLERHKEIVQKIFDVMKVKEPKHMVIVLKWSKSRKKQYEGYIWQHGDKYPFPKMFRKFLPRYTYVMLLYLPKTPKKIQVRRLPYLLGHEYRHWIQMCIMDKIPYASEDDANNWAFERIHEKVDELNEIIDEYENNV